MNKTNSPIAISDYDRVLTEVVYLLEAARSTAARSINAVMTATYWEIGRCIVEEEQGGKRRAGYGKELLKRLAADLTRRFGRGFGHRNLEQMRAFYSAWPISQSAIAKSEELTKRFPLPWTAYVHLLGVRDPKARAF